MRQQEEKKDLEHRVVAPSIGFYKHLLKNQEGNKKELIQFEKSGELRSAMLTGLVRFGESETARYAATSPGLETAKIQCTMYGLNKAFDAAEDIFDALRCKDTKKLREALDKRKDCIDQLENH